MLLVLKFTSLGAMSSVVEITVYVFCTVGHWTMGCEIYFVFQLCPNIKSFNFCFSFFYHCYDCYSYVLFSLFLLSYYFSVVLS